MATPSFAQYKQLILPDQNGAATSPGAGIPPDNESSRLITLLAVLLSGQNPDGSAFQLIASTAPAAAAVVVNGRQTVTTTAAALTASPLTDSVTVEALSTNTAPIFIGGPGVTPVTGLEVQPTAAKTLVVPNVNLIFVVASVAGQIVTWAGS